MSIFFKHLSMFFWKHFITPSNFTFSNIHLLLIFFLQFCSFLFHLRFYFNLIRQFHFICSRFLSIHFVFSSKINSFLFIFSFQSFSYFFKDIIIPLSVLITNILFFFNVEYFLLHYLFHFIVTAIFLPDILASLPP